MRITPTVVVAPILAALLFVVAGCETTPKNGTETTEDRPAPAEALADSNLERDLLNVKPHLAKTMSALDHVVATAGTPNLAPAMSEFKLELASLRRSADRVVADMDAQRRRSDAFFLDRDRTVATTGQPGVVAGRDKVGFVGEYIVQLRRDYVGLTDAFERIESILGTQTTADDVERARPYIAAAHRHRMNVDNDIDVLVQEMRRVGF